MPYIEIINTLKTLFIIMPLKKKKIKCPVILGPTSSGKSDLAVRLARKINGEIISADSRQIYQDMNLGTGKVKGKWEKTNPTSSKKTFVYKKIIHYLLDFKEPPSHFNDSEKYSVTNFKKDCLHLIKKISSKNKVPIICGGTGFWISAVVDNLEFPEVKPNAELRQKLAKKSTSSLFQELQKQDPQRSRTIDPHNKQRIIRALEICETLKTVPQIKSTPLKNIEFLQIGLDWPKEKLSEKIKKRLESRWTEGMIREVENLHQKYHLQWEQIQSFGLAYYWIPLYLQNKLTDEHGNFINNKKMAYQELIQRVYLAEKKYAKRQRTWFKRDKRIIWENNFAKILKKVKNFIEEK